MTGIELYIDNQLCEIGDPRNFSVYLKRQFINPKEMSIKDAQSSYSITLPATTVNNRIFEHRNVEEAQGKFLIYPDARLYMNGTLILDGKFRLSEITPTSYIGNLGVPAPITAKDVFGNTMMNQAGSWRIDFSKEKCKGMHPVTYYNTENSTECIFPLVLYGTLTNADGSKDVLNKDTRFTYNDIPPSVNCVEMLKKIFSNAGYSLTGTALHDERLKNLYVSYRNKEEYEMQYNYKKVSIKGSWTNCDLNNVAEENAVVNESEISELEKTKYNVYGCNLAKASNLEINSIENTTQENGKDYLYIIPRQGLYKIIYNSKAEIIVKDKKSWTKDVYIDNKRYPIVNPIRKGSNFSFREHESLIESKLIRFTDTTYDDASIVLDNTFYKNNQNQIYVTANNPQQGIFPEREDVNFVDSKQNPHLLSGLAFGCANDMLIHPLDKLEKNRRNGTYCNPIAIKYGESWNQDNEKDLPISYSAVSSLGYKRHKKEEDGTITEEELEEGEANFKVNVINAPSTYTQLNGKDLEGEGSIAQIVWLERGDKISVVAASYMRGTHILRHSVHFDFSIEPYRTDIDWLTSKMDINGGSKSHINWGEENTFLQNEIDLIQFLPAEIKVNEWIENFSKAFNLQLIHLGEKIFELNVKNKAFYKQANIIIDLDQKADVRQRSNTSLGLPQSYELGFAADTGEHGYYESMEWLNKEKTAKKVGSGETGGGKFETQSIDGTTVKQNSNFSYCWYKSIKVKSTSATTVSLPLPVITDNDAWNKVGKESSETKNRFFDKSQRFWYKTGTHTILLNEAEVKASLVSNTYKGKNELTLNYRDEPSSIAQNFFLLLTNRYNYTEVECLLTAQEYAQIGDSLIRFNGDLYHPAEVSAYDPRGLRKTKIKLIQRIE